VFGIAKVNFFLLKEKKGVFSHGMGVWQEFKEVHEEAALHLTHLINKLMPFLPAPYQIQTCTISLM